MKTYQRVFKEVTSRLAPLGFEQHGTTWWQSRVGRIWRRIHVHKFRAGDYFRVHAALHAVGIEDEAPWLNGPHSFDGWFEEKKLGLRIRKYDFHFHDSAESIGRCADELRDYISRIVVPWFDRWSDEQKLIEAVDSPLTAEAKTFLKKVPIQLPEPTSGLAPGRGSS